MPTGTLLVDLHIPHAGNLKDKRAVVRHLLDTSRQRYGVAAAEVGDLGLLRRSRLGFAAVGGSVAHVGEILDSVERFLLSHPEIELLGVDRVWSEEQ